MPDEDFSESALLSIASTFEVIPYNPVAPSGKRHLTELKVELRRRNPNKWAIVSSGCVWSKSHQNWVYEPHPSERTDQFFADTRYDTAIDALRVAKQIERGLIGDDGGNQ